MDMATASNFQGLLQGLQKARNGESKNSEHTFRTQQEKQTGKTKDKHR